MIILRMRITYSPPPTSVRRFNEVSRETYREGASYWTRQFLPRHFRHGADVRYGYKPRTPKYLRTRAKRGKPPLVHSGLTSSRISQGMPNIKPYPTRVKIELHVPSYIRMTPRGTKHPNMAREIFQTNVFERPQIHAVMGRYADRKLRETKERRTITIG